MEETLAKVDARSIRQETDQMTTNASAGKSQSEYGAACEEIVFDSQGHAHLVCSEQIDGNLTHA